MTKEKEAELFERYDIECFDYTDYPHKSFWSEGMGDSQYREALTETFSKQHDATTLYVHIPFCVELCYFCICHKEITQNQEKVKRHIYGSLLPELDLLVAHFKKTAIRPRITEVYLGGGSPTILEYAEFDALLEKIRQFVPIESLDRFNVEVDPRDVNEEKLRFYKSRGVTVISMGIQDFDPNVQKAVNRIQPIELVQERLRVARELFTSINFDLLAGLPYQTEESMRETVKQVVKLAPDRISFDYFRYNERFYPHMKILKGMNAFPDFVAKRKILAIAANGFAEAGYVRTGFEHFAKPDDRVAKALGRGTATYTSLGAITGSSLNVIATGRSGHGIIGNQYLFQNHYDQGLFKGAVDAGKFPIYRGHKLSDNDVMRRKIIRKLRTYFFLDIEAIEHEYSLNFDQYFRQEKEIFSHFMKDGLVVLDQRRLAVTETGLNFAELIASVFDAYTNKKPLAKLDSRRI